MRNAFSPSFSLPSSNSYGIPICLGNSDVLPVTSAFHHSVCAHSSERIGLDLPEVITKKGSQTRNIMMETLGRCGMDIPRRQRCPLANLSLTFWIVSFLLAGGVTGGKLPKQYPSKATHHATKRDKASHLDERKDHSDEAGHASKLSKSGSTKDSKKVSFLIPHSIFFVSLWKPQISLTLPSSLAIESLSFLMRTMIAIKGTKIPKVHQSDSSPTPSICRRYSNSIPTLLER